MNALGFDEGLAEPHATLGAILSEKEWKWREAENEFRRAVELNPNYAEAHNYYALHLGHLGRSNEAIEEINLALDLDPLSPNTHRYAAEEYYLAGRYDKALEAAQKALELDPNFGWGHLAAVQAYLGMEMYDEAVTELKEVVRLSRGALATSLLGYVFGISGRSEEAMKHLEELKLGLKKNQANTFLIGYGLLRVGREGTGVRLVREGSRRKQQHISSSQMRPDIQKREKRTQVPVAHAKGFP